MQSKRLQEQDNLKDMTYGEPEFHLVSSRHNSDLCKLVFFVAHCPGPQELVVGVRGTCNPSDVRTDATLEVEPFLDDKWHRGVVLSTRWLLDKSKPVLMATIEGNEVERVVFTGHSYKAVVVAAITLIIRCGEVKDTQDVLQNCSCVVLCSPSFLSESLAERSEGHRNNREWPGLYPTDVGRLAQPFRASSHFLRFGAILGS